jgi:Fibrinogen beta and gamma chains, C-terminal globular domain
MLHQNPAQPAHISYGLPAALALQLGLRSCRWGATGLTIALVACSVAPVTFTSSLAEDCAIVGDEDGNGLLDCSDLACADAASCQPACTDGQRNGRETDVDCGGTCAPCALGRACGVDRDCAGGGLCDPQQCRAARSCAEILAHFAGSRDGVYRIVPAGVSSPAEVVCDMTRDGGGWTLLLKGNGDDTLSFGSALWGDATLLNAADLTLQPGNAKYQSFVSMPISVLRGELDGFPFRQSLPAMNLTAAQLFNGEAIIVDTHPTFNTGAANWSTQPNCHLFGVNLLYNPPYTGARFGWSANQENDCLTNDTAIGLGLSTGRGAGYVCGSTECSAGIVDAGGTGLLWGR